jgi:hypothetical protein
VSWTRDALAAIKRIILIEDRIAALSKQSAEPMEVCNDMDWRLVHRGQVRVTGTNGRAGSPLAT